MGKWKKTELKRYINVVNGFAFKSKNFLNYQKENTLPVVKIKNVANGDANLTGVQYHLYEETFSPFLIEKGDILIALTGNHPDAKTQVVGAVSAYKMTERSLLNQRVAKIIPKQGISKEYLYYFLKDEETRNWLAQQSSGSANQANISKKNIEGIPILLPSLSEQRAIVSVLSSLDDKIDLLHRQNTTLEKMAETFFRQWFVEEVKEEWKMGQLSDEFDFTMGASPLGESYNEDAIGTPMYQGNTDFGFRFPTNRVFTTDPKKFAEKYDTLISVRAPVGEQNMANEKCCIGRGVAAFRYKKNNSFYSYTYYKLMSLMEEIKQFNETGTVFGAISKTDFESIEIMIPDNKSIVEFQNTTRNIDLRINTNTEQIHTLTSLRDTLLPKLMSGEVRVEM
ncbi:MAG: restriction endonuclease subunit S [Bacilli bacterium]|nr:restriction endonuclease subunit S [Bacilli bacterium]